MTTCFIFDILPAYSKFRELMKKTFSLSVLLVLALAACSSPSSTETTNPPVDPAAPSLTLATPTSNLTTAQSITLTATAANGTFSKVEFSDENKNVLGSVDSSPFKITIPIDQAMNGTHVYQANGTTADAKTVKSNAVTVTVSILTAPAVTEPISTGLQNQPIEGWDGSTARAIQKFSNELNSETYDVGPVGTNGSFSAVLVDPPSKFLTTVQAQGAASCTFEQSTGVKGAAASLLANSPDGSTSRTIVFQTYNPSGATTTHTTGEATAVLAYNDADFYWRGSCGTKLYNINAKKGWVFYVSSVTKVDSAGKVVLEEVTASSVLPVGFKFFPVSQ